VSEVADRPQVLLSRREIESRIAELGEDISRDYDGGGITVVGVLVGAFMFAADLVRAITVPVEIDFVRASSYGDGRTSSGRVELVPGTWQRVSGRDVLVVEDVFDTGRTFAAIVAELQNNGARSVRSAALLQKPGTNVRADYVGFDIDDLFVVGYGLDDGGKWRNLPYVGFVATE